MRVETYFKNKIAGYKEQDKRQQRPIDEDEYVDVEFLMNIRFREVLFSGTRFLEVFAD